MAVQNSRPQLFSGARGKVTFTDPAGVDHVLAIITDVSVNVRENLRPAYVVGELNPVSIEPLSIDVDCSIGRMIPMNVAAAAPDTAKTADGYSKLTGDGSQVTARALNLEEQIGDILSKDSVIITIQDKLTDATIATVKHARFSGRSMSVNSGDLAQERINYVGIFDGANGNSAPTGY